MGGAGGAFYPLHIFTLSPGGGWGGAMSWNREADTGGSPVKILLGTPRPQHPQTASAMCVGLVVLTLFSCLTLIICSFFLNYWHTEFINFFQEQVWALLIFLDHVLMYILPILASIFTILFLVFDLGPACLGFSSFLRSALRSPIVCPSFL